MAKYGNSHYMELSRCIFTDDYKHLSQGAKWLFVVLNELEQRYTTGREGGEDFFFRSDLELAADAGISITTLKRYKAELRKTDLIQVWQMHWVDKKTGKKSEKKGNGLSHFEIAKAQIYTTAQKPICEP